MADRLMTAHSVDPRLFPAILSGLWWLAFATLRP